MPGYCFGATTDGVGICHEHVCDSDVECLEGETCLGFCRLAGTTPPGAPCVEPDECVAGYHCESHDPRDFGATTCLPACYTETGGWDDALCGAGEICAWAGAGCALPCDPADPSTCDDALGAMVCRSGQCTHETVAATCTYHADGSTDCELGQVCVSFGFGLGMECMSPTDAAARYPRPRSGEPQP